MSKNKSTNNTELIGEIKKNPMYTYLLVLSMAAAAGFQGWRTLFNNFAVDEIGLNGFNVGMIQSVREIPGFLAMLVVYLLLIFKEHKLSAYSVIFLGVSVALTGFFPSYLGLAITTVMMSVGFHYFETTNQSLTLQYFNHQQAPVVFARIRSITALSNIAVGTIIFLMSAHFSFQQEYLLLGAFAIAVGLWVLRRDPSDANKPAQHKKILVRKKYWLFYVLNFLSGARRQIFVVFAVFLLVKKYEFSIQEVTILFVANNVIAYFFNPLIAKGINRFGERKVLTLEYASLFFIFLAYATIENRWVVAGLYIFDHIFFNFSIAIRTYFQKTGDPKDIAPSMAMAFTINHIAAVVIPVVGGALWLLDWRIPFVAAAVLCLASLFFAQKMRIPMPSSEQEHIPSPQKASKASVE